MPAIPHGAVPLLEGAPGLGGAAGDLLPVLQVGLGGPVEAPPGEALEDDRPLGHVLGAHPVVGDPVEVLARQLEVARAEEAPAFQRLLTDLEAGR